MDEPSTSAARCLAVWCLVSIALGAAGRFAAGPLLSWSPGAAGPRFEELLTLLAAAAALASLAWLWLMSSVVLVGAAAGRLWSVPGCPAPLRRALLAACGIALASGLSPAHAEPGVADPGRAEPSGRGSELSGLISELPLPDRAESVGPPSPSHVDGPASGPERATPRGPAPASGRESAREPAREPARESTPGPDQGAAEDPSRPVVARGTVTVRAGDTLWAIAADRLPDGASDASVAAAVGAWHRRNEATIGADPDLILPGQRLTPPGKDANE